MAGPKDGVLTQKLSQSPSSLAEGLLTLWLAAPVWTGAAALGPLPVSTGRFNGPAEAGGDEFFESKRSAALDFIEMLAAILGPLPPGFLATTCGWPLGLGSA